LIKCLIHNLIHSSSPKRKRTTFPWRCWIWLCWRS